MPYDIPFTVECFPLAAYLRLIDWGYLFSSKSPASRDLIEDVILEILSRLPVKSLVRFKLVCKQWYAIIESQSFIDQHFDQRSNKERLLVCHRHFKNNCSGSDMMIDEVLGPMNGVFCLIGQSGKLALLNLATRQLKPLPKLSEVIVEPHVILLHNVFGFGLVPLSGDYKVVSILYFSDKRVNIRNCNPFVFIYNLSSDSWRKLKDVGCFKSSYMANRSLCKTYLNGAYYWTMGDNIVHFNSILAFDMLTEKFQEIHVPNCLKLKCGHLTIHGDSIALLSYELPVAACEVWVMKMAGNWNRVAVVGPYQDMVWPHCLWKDNELVIQTKTSLLILCNIYTKKRQLTQAPEKENAFYLSMIFSYKESLVSIKGERDNCMMWDSSPHILTIA